MSVAKTQPCTSHSLRFAGRLDRDEHSGEVVRHPAVSNCEKPQKLRCRNCPFMVVKRCGTSSRAKCAPCSESYRRTVHHVARSGLLLPGKTYLLTLSAIGAQVHGYRNWTCKCTTASNKLDDEMAIAKWNGECVANWNRLHQAIERRLGCEVSCFKVVEVQQRGALHLHVLIRVPKGCKLRVSALRALAIRHHFGHSVDLQSISDERAAWYVVKYASKAVDEREDAPYVHARTGEVGPGKWRTWTSTRGKRAWGETMRSVRAQQALWWSQQHRNERQQGGGPAKPDDACDGVAGALDPYSARYAFGGFVGPVEVLPLPM